jgi:hypothetical protein
MAEGSCKHEWKIVNLRTGYLVTEGCTRTGARAAFFTPEDKIHRDSYIEGKHHWRFMGSSQAVKFDLECEKCGELVKLDNVVGLAACLECKEDCLAFMEGKHLGGDDAWVYLAMCSLSTHEEGKCVTERETKALTEYFNSRIKTPGKKVVFVPDRLRANIDTCQAEVIADIGLKDLF